MRQLLKETVVLVEFKIIVFEIVNTNMELYNTSNYSLYYKSMIQAIIVRIIFHVTKSAIFKNVSWYE